MGTANYSILESKKVTLFPTNSQQYPSSMKTKIRQATPHDAKVVTEFNALLAEETEHRTLERRLLLRGVRGVLKDRARGIYYLAEIDGEVVGQLMITYEWSDWRNANFWWIQSVYVMKEFRQHGIFRSLYDHVEKLARKRKGVCGLRLYVERENRRAQTTYEKLGMKRTVYEMFEKDFVL